MAGRMHAQVVADFNVVPMPDKIEINKQKAGFSIARNVVIQCMQPTEEMMRNAMFLSEYLEDNIGRKIIIDNKPNKKVARICLALNSKIAGQEDYRITVSADRILIEGASAQGVF
ncbi:MAG: glycoside hydrolase family 20 zincin-like fold domain-containing protein, partial [Prevotella sp.]|nr:glycoside hydrolase family 20 zincin-like fold domain-containing protein [Prevotella sp.]